MKITLTRVSMCVSTSVVMKNKNMVTIKLVDFTFINFL